MTGVIELDMKLKVFTILTLAGTVALSGCSANKSGSGSSAEPTKAAKTETPERQRRLMLTGSSTAGFWNPPQWSTEPGTVNGRNYEKDGAYLQLQHSGTGRRYEIESDDGFIVGTFPDVITTVGPDMGRS